MAVFRKPLQGRVHSLLSGPGWKRSIGSSSISGGGGGSSASSSYSASGPGAELKSWERGAKLVQNTTVENKYLEHIRDVHDPSQHLKTIEDELKGTIGKALGKQGQKVLMYARLMDQERIKYEELLLEIDNNCDDKDDDKDDNGNDGGSSVEEKRLLLREAATAHNEWRKECLHARWELIVHRQAVGFIVGNHKFVQEKFPIADALPVDGDSGSDNDNDNNNDKATKPKPKKFTDQLDWWSRIGRWK